MKKKSNNYLNAKFSKNWDNFTITISRPPSPTAKSDHYFKFVKDAFLNISPPKKIHKIPSYQSWTPSWIFQKHILGYSEAFWE